MELKEILDHHIPDHVYFLWQLGALKLPVTKHLVMMWISGLALFLGTAFIYRFNTRFFSLLRGAVESVVVYIRDEVVLAAMGEKGLRYTPYFCTLFFFILVCNLIGLVPFGATATGNISVTAALALTTFALINFAGIREQGLWHYIKSMVPSGVPLWLYPILFPIEIIGLGTKTFALCIRLFANMISGHIVIFCLLGFIIVFGKLNLYLGLFVTAPFSVSVALFVTLLEVMVAVLQAYIFTFLTAIFTGLAMHPH